MARVGGPTADFILNLSWNGFVPGKIVKKKKINDEP